MNTKTVRVSHRGEDSAHHMIQAKAPRRAIPWRKITLVAAPLLFSVGNLVEARFEKQRAVKAGDNKFEQLRGVGNAAKQLAIEQGAAVGRTDYLGQTQAAHNRRLELLPAYRREADSVLAQALAESSLTVNQAIMTKNIVGPMRPIFLIHLELARIEAETDYGILLRINDGNPDPPEGNYPVAKIEFVGKTNPSPARRNELIRLRAQLQSKLPGLTAILRYAGAAIARERIWNVTCQIIDVPHVHAAERPR
jgi:hypothetical protein